ncbi:MAG: hypothetical protein U9N83_06730 [Thermodesulfobacteriota bacterium]|nr:hypothetical protein [Thermodesulfobacteriota bacterium]
MNDSKKINSFLVPSIADIIIISIFLYLSFSGGKGLLNDGDTGYHIRAGEYIIDTLSIPKQDIFSFLTPPLPWTAHEWLSEIIMATVHGAFGLTGIFIFFSFIISLVYYLLFKILRKNNNDIIIAALIVILVLAASKIHWLARPHIFSLLLMVIWYYLLDEYQYNHKNYLYFFPPIMLIWVNLHGGFLAGFILIGIYLFGNTVKLITSQDIKRDNYKKKVRLLGLITIACLFVCLINPYGYRILLFPFNLVSNKFIMDHIREFMTPNFHLLSVKPFEITILLVFIVLVFSKKRLNIIELVLILLFTHMSLYSARYIPLFSIIVAPILFRQLSPILDSSDGKFAKFIKKRSDNVSEIDASTRGCLWPVAAVILVIVLAKGGKIDFKFDPKTKPVAAVEFLKKENIKGNMFDNDEFGDYIIYAAWPKYKVFFDGRNDMYGAERLKEYFKVTGIKPGWDEVLNKYNIKWVIYNANSHLSMFLMERDDWMLIYADKVANIFVKDIPEYQYLIEKYPDVELVVDEDEE